MQPKQPPIQPDRVRRPPAEGWSWIDRRFLKEKAPALPRDAILLYFFLAAASDKHGVSFWSDTSIAAMLRIPETAVTSARQELEFHDLVAYQRPRYQVLSIQSSPAPRKSSEPTLLADIFREIAERGRDSSASQRKDLDQ